MDLDWLNQDAHPPDDRQPGEPGRRVVSDPRVSALDYFHRTGCETRKALAHRAMYHVDEDWRQELLHQIIAEEIIFTRHMQYAITILVPSVYNARPPIGRAEQVADIVGHVFFNLHRIAEGHHALLEQYKAVQVAEFPYLDTASLLSPLTNSLLELQPVYAAFLAHAPFAQIALEDALALQGRLRAHLDRMARAPSADGQDALALLAAPALHLRALAAKLSQLFDDADEELAIALSVLAALEDVEPAPAGDEAVELDRLEARERCIAQGYEDAPKGREEDERDERFRRDFWFVHPVDDEHIVGGATMREPEAPTPTPTSPVVEVGTGDLEARMHIPAQTPVPEIASRSPPPYEPQDGKSDGGDEWDMVSERSAADEDDEDDETVLV